METAVSLEVLGVFMGMNVKKLAGLFLLLLLCWMLTGCRTRTGMGGSGNRGKETNVPFQGTSSLASSYEDEDAEDWEKKQEKNEETGDKTKENPEASRKEYDEQAPAEIVPTAGRAIHTTGEGSGTSALDEQANAAAKISMAATETAVQTVMADRAEQRGVSADAVEADSALTYYTVLLQERMGGLFECQRLSVYWETKEDHVTIFKTSQEHSLIVNAGAYDVSARLMKENLRVDDGWIGRKNPGVIVKAVDNGVLGAGISSTGKAQMVYASLTARPGFAAIDAVRNGKVILLSQALLEAPYLQTAAMLVIAKTANPALMEDVDIQRALTLLAEEAAGSALSGHYYYNGQGGFQ